MRPSAAVPGRTARRGLGAAAAAVLLSVVLAGCGDDAAAPDSSAPATGSSESATTNPSGSASGSPSATPSETPTETEAEPAGPTLEVEVTGDEVAPMAEQVDLAVGETLTIAVRSDRAGELHVHSDPEHTYTFGSGTERFRLTLDTPGSVDIEEHESDALVARVLVR